MSAPSIHFEQAFGAGVHPTDTLKSFHSPGTPRRLTEPSEPKARSVPVARSRTVRGHDDLPIRGLSQGSRRDMDADPTDVVVADLDLPRVDRRTDLEPDVAQRVGECERATERPGRGVERRQDPVAGGLHEPATEALNLPAGDLVVSIQQATPPLVSDRGRALRGM